MHVFYVKILCTGDEMTNLYLNENLVLDSSKKYVIDSNFLTDVSYYVKKEFIIERYDEAIEKRRAGEINNLGEESIKYHVEIFKKNFSRAFRVPMNILNQRIQEYAYEMLSYLDRTFPYCLFENGDVHTKDLDSSLFFFAKNNLLAQLLYIIFFQIIAENNFLAQLV